MANHYNRWIVTLSLFAVLVLALTLVRPEPCQSAGTRATPDPGQGRREGDPEVPDIYMRAVVGEEKRKGSAKR